VIWSPEYLMTSRPTDHKAPRYLVSSTSVLFRLF
jgi:hypothetical protein